MVIRVEAIGVDHRMVMKYKSFLRLSELQYHHLPLRWRFKEHS